MYLIVQKKLFVIYVAKNDQWQKLESEDWEYVSSMVRFFKWWSNRFFDLDLDFSADILPVIPGKLFDRVGIAYLARDHKGRDPSVFHFYLTYFKPLWTDCKTEGYYGEGFAQAYWKRTQDGKEVEDFARRELFASDNCPRISHVLAHHLLRLKGRTKTDYFGNVHELWDKHLFKDLPFIYFDSQFHRTRKDSQFKFATIDPDAI